MDTALLFLINKQWTSPPMDRLMAILSNFDVWRPILLLVVLALLWWGGFRWRAFLISLAMVIAFTDGIFTQVAKHLVNRPRPAESLANVRVVNLAKTKPAVAALFRPVQTSLSPAPEPTGHVTGRSFPSGHAMNNIVIATLALLFFRHWGLAYLFPAILVCYSRIYCGSHWPSDILVSVVLAIGFSLVGTALLVQLYRYAGPRWFAKFWQQHPSLVELS